MSTTRKPYDAETAAIEDVFRALYKHIKNLSPCQLLGVIETVKIGLSKNSVIEEKHHEH